MWVDIVWPREVATVFSIEKIYGTRLFEFLSLTLGEDLEHLVIEILGFFSPAQSTARLFTALGVNLADRSLVGFCEEQDCVVNSLRCLCGRQARVTPKSYDLSNLASPQGIY